MFLSKNILDRVLNPGDQEIAFALSGTPQDPPPGFRVEGCAMDIDPGVALRQGETVTVCLPPAEIKGESYIHRYDDEWELLPSGLETVDDGTTTGNELLCGKTDTFSPLFRVSVPEIESAQGVTHSEDMINHVFSLTPVGEGGSIRYGEETIGLSVTGDVDPSSASPAVIVPRDILDRVEEITFELSEVSPHDPPPGYRLQGFTAEVDLGVAFRQGETVSVCLPSSGGDIYRYSKESGEWEEVLESRPETVNEEDVLCAEAGSFSLSGVFVEETGGGCAVASTGGEGVLWRGAVFNLLLIISVLLLIPGVSKLGVYDRKASR